ncbi:hypothetical protein [Yersinia pseudotuberculosis]|uniref:hypothetical protein n=1 Tax=Yersinia pseudotuberculosis TaxID=633 RepID=UPI0005AD300B|nr:hypothetical protein [Yersinia pseudotuberculosis]AJJ73221.1 hypothetical protein BZ23_701 [Yersinia pseudotuberculosis]AYX13016.1 DNA primase [Yersinia pseudotuberculosis]MBO1567226.1 DNA primase [Yersinia pseudotuberculosis]MBO1604085.1 DNA primase [Yersinia pseudotuberculosis]CNI87574.1 Uncharacterised protein [Yersinia pseudotuberculosis]
MAKIQGFAHLFGRGAKASDEPDDEKDEEKDEEARKAKKAEEEEEARKAKKAEENNEDPDASDDGDDGEDNDGDDSDESSDAKKGRRAERNRCARIFGSKHATGRGDLAVSLALNSGMSSAAVIRVLASTTATAPASASAPRKRSLDERMQALGNTQPGQDAAVASKGASLVNKMASLYDSAKGKK